MNDEARRELQRLAKKETKLLRMLSDIQKRRQELQPSQLPWIERRPRGRKSTVRSHVLEVIRQNPGKTRGELAGVMGLDKKDKSAMMSLSNALTALSKSGKVSVERWTKSPYGIHHGVGRYVVR